MWIHHLIHIHMCTRSPKELSPVLTCMTLRDIQFLIHRAPSDVGPPLQVELFWEGCPQDLGVCVWDLSSRSIFVRSGPWLEHWFTVMLEEEGPLQTGPTKLGGRNCPTCLIQRSFHWNQGDETTPPSPTTLVQCRPMCIVLGNHRTREPPESSGGVHSTASSDALRWPCWWTAWMQPLGRGHPSPKLSALFWS